MSATETSPPARLKARYLEEIRPSLIERFGYSSVMQAPKVEKITLNMGVGLAKQDSKMMKAASDQLAMIAGQRPSVRRARKSIAAFKLREGMPVGVSVTLRGERGYEFLDRLVTIAIPRIRDFRGLNPRSFDGRGNYSMGVKEQIIFPEVDYDGIDQVRGLDITITTSARTDEEAYALLSALGMPFSAQGRPRGYDPEADEAAAQAHAEEQAAQEAAAAAPEPKPEAAAAPEPEAAADEAAPEAGSEPEPEPDAAAEPEAEAAPEPDAAAEPEAEAAPEPDAAAEPEAEAAPEPEAAAEPEPEASSEAGAEPAPEPEAAAEPEGAAEPDAATEPEPAAEPEAAAAPEAEPAAGKDQDDSAEGAEKKGSD
jgi:large subunit ribosomal protein L5